MHKHRGLLMSLAISAVMGLMGSQAHAGPITLSIDLNGVSIFSFASVAPDQSVTVPVAAVNSALAANDSAYVFTALAPRATTLVAAQVASRPRSLSTPRVLATLRPFSRLIRSRAVSSPRSDQAERSSAQPAGVIPVRADRFPIRATTRGRLRPLWCSPCRAAIPLEVLLATSPSGRSRRATSFRTTS